ncbi:alpha/beta fold hydrolase [Streptomyces sp. TLI_171]|uniref:alpha/beta fold hydrolase n=1 Tax=Streptomyces sp. TLI_171 TaxID=1938859 RepID=UPI000C183200|nr:alpha/beta hydrolase [Streptomyces sp. TLI_171]RKE17292.1 pimeloyl-ACP methyl ester carboxylesterase [Streptomyces sp. TLI_171]
MSENLEVRRAGPPDAARRVLLLPGGMCTSEFYADVLARPAVAGLGMVAATLPGFGRTPPPADLSLENYARLMGAFAADERCDVVVGHSLGANVAIEMAALGVFTGPLVLLSPTFSRADEATFLGILDTVGRAPVIGAWAWSAMLRTVPAMMKKDMLKAGIPAERAQTLAADMGNNDPAFCRGIVRRYYDYLARHPSLVARLRDSGAQAWIVRGDHDEIDLKDEERRELEASPRITMVDVPNAGHLLLVEQPAPVAEVIVEATEAVSP